jgi:DNA invertase Pin-like site-specific DNA recombinase
MQPLPPPGSRVAFYSRYSTDRQNQNSIAGQERLCAAYAKEQGWVEAGRFSDAEKSGTTTMGRSGLFKMLAAAERGEFEVLLVEDIDRTSRDAADMHQIAKELDELEIVLCTVCSGVVSDIELAFKAVQNQQFIKQNVQKSKRGQELAISQGRMSGSVAYGYRKIPKFDEKGEPINGLREIDPEKAKIVQRIHQEFDAGRTTFEICKTLNAEGIPSPKGKQWRPGALLGNRQGGLGILRNPIYIGEYHFRKTHRQRRKGEIKMSFKPEVERLITHHPELRIIDQGLWDRNQERLAEHLDRPFFRKRRKRYAFSGNVFCGECGSPAIVSGGKYLCTGHRDFGVCSNTRRVHRELVEATVFERLKTHILNPVVLGPALDAYRDEVHKVQSGHAEQCAKLQSELSAIEKRIKNITVQLTDASERSHATQILVEELNQLGAHKARVEKQIKCAPPDLIPGETDEIIKAISATVDNLSSSLDADDPEAARAKELLRGLITKVTLTPVGPPSDGRGAGDIRVSVEGPIANLIDLAAMDINRVTKNGHRPMLDLENANLVWSFSYDIRWEDPRLETVFCDLQIIARLLDEADVPVPMSAMEVALAAADEGKEKASDRSPEKRARMATMYLQDRGFTRCINMRSPQTGYVWNERGLSDDEWKARIDAPPMTKVIPTVRLTPAAASAVVVRPQHGAE